MGWPFDRSSSVIKKNSLKTFGFHCVLLQFLVVLRAWKIRCRELILVSNVGCIFPRCTNPGRQILYGDTSVYGLSVWILLHVTLLVAGILRWLLNF